MCRQVLFTTSSNIDRFQNFVAQLYIIDLLSEIVPHHLKHIRVSTTLYNDDDGLRRRHDGSLVTADVFV